MNWKNKKVLVTGGAGQIGSNLVMSLVEKGAIVSVVDNLWRGVKSNLYKHGKPVIDMDKNFHELDLVNYDNCLKVVADQDIIYHLADVVAGINYVFGNQFSLFNQLFHEIYTSQVLTQEPLFPQRLTKKRCMFLLFRALLFRHLFLLLHS